MVTARRAAWEQVWALMPSPAGRAWGQKHQHALPRTSPHTHTSFGWGSMGISVLERYRGHREGEGNLAAGAVAQSTDRKETLPPPLGLGTASSL